MKTSLVLVTPPSTLPVTVADLKEHLRLVHDSDDDYIESLSNVAYNWIADEADISISATVWKLVMDDMPVYLTLPKPPLISVTTVQYYDSDNSSQTLDSSDYYVVAPYRQAARIVFKDSVQTYLRPDAVLITYSAGFSTVPYQIPHLMRLLVATMYENREGEIVGTISKKLDLGVDRLMSQVRNYRYA